MKKLFWALVAALALPLSAWAADCAGQNTTNCIKQGGNSWVVGGSQTFMTGGSLIMEAGSTADVGGVAFSTAQTGNPLMKGFYQEVTTASANATTPIIASATGKSIYVIGGSVSIMASGTASGATAVVLKCSGGTALATFPIATLVDLVPTGPFSSNVITKGAALTKPCPSGEAVLISSTGTLATTTRLYVNGLYIPK